MYKLTLNEEQVKVVMAALDLFARIGCGQWEEVLRHPTIRKILLETKQYDSQQSRIRLEEAKMIIMNLTPYTSIGITAADEPNRVAYDIFQVIANWLAWDKNPEGGSTVNFQKPMKVSNQPLPVMGE